MKKKGSALILSILMLSFFMTITLTMYYIARNRNKRSIYKIKGMRISSGLDSGSAIAHYELYLADEYVSRGHPYEPVTTSYGALYGVKKYPYSSTTPPTITQRYTQQVTSGDAIILVPEAGKHYTGVVLNNYNEYFASYWDPEIGTATVPATSLGVTSSEAIQPWIAEDKVKTTSSGPILISRAWMNNTGEKIVRLWTETTGSAISVGGYRLINIEGANAPLNIGAITDSSITLTYEKIVSASASGIGVEDYRITYVEKVTTSGGSIIADELDSMTVEKLK